MPDLIKHIGIIPDDSRSIYDPQQLYKLTGDDRYRFHATLTADELCQCDESVSDLPLAVEERSPADGSTVAGNFPDPIALPLAYLAFNQPVYLASSGIIELQDSQGVHTSWDLATDQPDRIYIGFGGRLVVFVGIPNLNYDEVYQLSIPANTIFTLSQQPWTPDNWVFNTPGESPGGIGTMIVGSTFIIG